MSADDDPDDSYPDKPTPPIRKTRYAMTDAQRDGGERRRAEARAITDSERRRHAELYASGMPAVLPTNTIEDPDTGPIAMLESIELDADDFQQMHRLRRESPDPYVMGLKLAKLIRKLKHEERSNNQARADQLLDLLNRPPHEDVADLRRDVEAMQRDMVEHGKAIVELAPVRRGMRWLQASLVVVVLGVGTWLYARGGADTEIKLRIQYLEDDHKRLEHALDRLEPGHKP